MVRKVKGKKSRRKLLLAKLNRRRNICWTKQTRTSFPLSKVMLMKMVTT